MFIKSEALPGISSGITKITAMVPNVMLVF